MPQNYYNTGIELMKKEIYTFAMMSYAGRPMKTFSISRFTLIAIAISFMLVIASSATLATIKIWGSYKKQVKTTEIALDKYEVLRNDFRRLQVELIGIKQSCQGFKNILGVEMESSVYVDKNAELSGKGGPEESDITLDDLAAPDGITSDLKQDMSFTMREALSLRSDIDGLLRGANSKLAKLATIPSICPVWLGMGDDYRISSFFGMRPSPFTGLPELHQGLDIPAPLGTPVIASADGVVSTIGQGGGLGNYVTIRHSDKYSTVYGHLFSTVNGMYMGKKVKRYDIIGYVGSTGRSTGNHLHYEVRDSSQRINPSDFILP
jgi:murein DD-endopeptidase MepM/ murein hydrolase activator NlpD